jgi:uncharacterized protein (TIGR02284 family)
VGTMAGKQKGVADLLNALLQLDIAAIAAYEAAIDRLDDVNDKVALRAFKGDHEIHVRDLQALLSALGEKPPRPADTDGELTKRVLGSVEGDRAVLLAMKTKEDDANVAYDHAVERDDVPADVHDVLVQNRNDERRHRAYIEMALGRTR